MCTVIIQLIFYKNNNKNKILFLLLFLQNRTVLYFTKITIKIKIEPCCILENNRPNKLKKIYFIINIIKYMKCMKYKPIIFFVIIFIILFFIHFNSSYLLPIERYFKIIFIIFGLCALILPGITNILGNGSITDDIQMFMKNKYLNEK